MCSRGRRGRASRGRAQLFIDWSPPLTSLGAIYRSQTFPDRSATGASGAQQTGNPTTSFVLVRRIFGRDLLIGLFWCSIFGMVSEYLFFSRLELPVFGGASTVQASLLTEQRQMVPQAAVWDGPRVRLCFDPV